VTLTQQTRFWRPSQSHRYVPYRKCVSVPRFGFCSHLLILSATERKCRLIKNNFAREGGCDFQPSPVFRRALCGGNTCCDVSTTQSVGRRSQARLTDRTRMYGLTTPALLLQPTFSSVWPTASTLNCFTVAGTTARRSGHVTPSGSSRRRPDTLAVVYPFWMLHPLLSVSSDDFFNMSLLLFLSYAFLHSSFCPLRRFSSRINTHAAPQSPWLTLQLHYITSLLCHLLALVFCHSITRFYIFI
jgi:hypothetical protein